MVDSTQYLKRNPRMVSDLYAWVRPARAELGIAANGGLFTGP